MTRFFSRLAPYVAIGARIFLQVFLVVGLLIYGFYALSAVTFPFPLDYGEAPLVDQAMRLASGETIYHPNIDTPPHTITNYPPVYLLALLPFTGDTSTIFQAGRLISVMSALATAVFLALIVHRLSQNRFAALVTATVFLSVPYVVTWSGLLRIDLLALALSTAALYVLVRWPASRVAMIGGGLLLLAAIYTRQSYALAAPLAAFGWLWSQQGQRRALELTAVVTIPGLLLFILLALFTGGGFFFHIVRANFNAFSWEQTGEWLINIGELMPILIGGGLLLLGFGYKQQLKGWPLLALYTVGSLLSALTIGKIGSNVNYLLELSAALSLLIGSLLAWRLSTERQTAVWQSALIMVLLALQLGRMINHTMSRLDDGLAARKQDQGALVELESLLNQSEEPILADEYMGLLTRNERPLYAQPFEISQLANDGIWDQTPLLTEIGNQTFNYILIHHFSPYPLYRDRWTPEMLDAIETHYRPWQTRAGTVVYKPKESTQETTLATPTTLPTFIPEIQVGDLTAVNDSAFVIQPHLAINPQNPQQLAATAITLNNAICDSADCEVSTALYTSQDGGQSWQAQAPFTAARAFTFSPITAFAPDGTLFVLGLRDGAVTINKATATDNYEMTLANQSAVTRGQVAARPWLQIEPLTGNLFLSYGAQLESRKFVTPSLLRSTSAGERWSSISRADQRVSVADFEQNLRATAPDDIQILFGEGEQVAMLWVWEAAPWTWPRDIWLATSDDGGRNFEPPQRLGETWGPISATSENGRYYFTYRTGDEIAPQLTLASSEDHGQTWQTTDVNGTIPLNFDTDKAPGLDVAPDGTVDLLFYAPAAPCERTLDEWSEGWATGDLVDPCTYNVYYTYSEDNGRSFSQPLRLNETAIIGENFVRFGNISQVGTHMGMASSDTAAFPLWIATDGDGTQAVTVRIER